MSGTKVSTDPEGYENPIQEGTGFVASDSLAAESLRKDGDFAADDPNAAASGQGAYGSTASNTDTSGATTLEPARDATRRSDEDSYDPQDGQGGDSTRRFDQDATSGDTGYGTRGEQTGDSYTGGSEASEGRSGYGTSRSGADTYGDDGQAGVAPSYVRADELAGQSSDRPKGRNLQEGGFDDDAPNASFDSEIGSKDDPGRLAEQKFDETNAGNQYDAGLGSVRKQTSLDEDNPYDALKDQSA